MRLGVVVLVAACSSGSSDPPQAIDRPPPAPAERTPPPEPRANRGLPLEAPDPASATGVTASQGSATAHAAPAPSTPFATLTARWSNIRGTGACFYFSGPSGRDNQLVGDVTVERSGDRAILHIGGATFAGTYRDGELAVTRHSVHDYGGRWTVDETIRGRYLERLMRATYHYEECQDGDTCPGTCVLDARLVFAR
jgi:hypothetical protein